MTVLKTEALTKIYGEGRKSKIFRVFPPAVQ